ncbi:acyltransferase-domain-containing protein [Westerdykella ornata]|uniref:Acyltransferase-domain-containing protein n=1 Tax=Westerdykella ornata TaxID=318751 RepID=A0A6A6JGL6_WESOR|nr:acyltransferase-domain-containing protein [Westerdykella ornata]KAF2274776.1 acyltransferase-domain-containing protein [Westerdykella ornata]
MSPIATAAERKRKTEDLGAGLSIAKPDIDNHPAGPPRHGELSQAERAFTLASTFMSGVLAATQLLGAPLKLIDPVFYEGYMAYTKECFAILITCLTQWWAPTVVRVSWDSSMVGQLIRKKDGSLQCNFANRMVLMANHQLYTDWLYLWWIAYCNNMHGFIYIILKESLKNIPIIGWGCQFYNFIFLSRKWEQDRTTFESHLSQLNKPNDPMWLIIFPEGTNLSASTREKSRQWAEKNGVQDMKHQLLPRSTGLRFCLQQLRQTTEWLYDCTIAYEGVPEGQFGQDIFTLRSSFFEGRPPKSVNMHWRRFHLDSIPIDNGKAFEVWLRNRWREKDYMLEYFVKNKRFPAEDFWKQHLDLGSQQSTKSGRKSLRGMPKPAVSIETEVKSGNWNEFVKIFAPITSVVTALAIAYGASPDDLPLPGAKEFLQDHLKTLLKGGEMKGLPSPDELEKTIVNAAKMGGKRDGRQKEHGTKVQELTQENLAKLVKETAIKSGMVLPGGIRKPGPAPPVRSVRALQKGASGAAESQTPARTRSGANLLSPAKNITYGSAKPAPDAPSQMKPASPGQMQNVMTKSGVMIKIPKTQAQEAKKTGTIVTKDGVVIKVGKMDAEEARKEKSGVVMTSSGVPIKITPSGTMGAQQKPTPGAQDLKRTAKPTVASKQTPSLTEGISPAKKTAQPDQTRVATKKTFSVGTGSKYRPEG